MRIGRRGRRSTQTPAGSVNRMKGRNSTTPSSGDLERGRVEHEQRHERQRELRDLRPELADRLGRPQLEEVAVAPEAAGRPEATHRRRHLASAGSAGRAEERERERVQCSPSGSSSPLEVGDEAVQPLLEARRRPFCEPHVQEPGSVVLGARGEHLVGGLLQHHRGGDPRSILGATRRFAERRASRPVRSTSR